MFKDAKNNPHVRHLALGASMLIGMSIMQSTALAQSSYPDRPINLILAYPPGGGVDTVGRLLARELEGTLGQTVIVENKPGAGSLIGTNALIRSKPDGYTIMLVDPALVINSSLLKNTPYNVDADITPISTITLSPLALAVPSTSGIKTVADLVTEGKSKATGLNYASAGIGTTPHMAGELLKLQTGANLVHVPYKGSGPAMTDLISGQVDFAFATQPAVAQHIASGKLRGLATTGSEPSRLLSSLPTVSNSFNDFRVLFWTALIAPAGTPEPIVQKLNQAVRNALDSEKMKLGLEKSGETAAYMSVAETKKFFNDEKNMWAKVVKESNLQVE